MCVGYGRQCSPGLPGFGTSARASNRLSKSGAWSLRSGIILESCISVPATMNKQKMSFTSSGKICKNSEQYYFHCRKKRCRKLPNLIKKYVIQRVDSTTARKSGNILLTCGKLISYDTH